MSELENIQNHTHGEIPEGEYTILKVKNIKFPQEDLNDFNVNLPCITFNLFKTLLNENRFNPT